MQNFSLSIVIYFFQLISKVVTVIFRHWINFILPISSNIPDVKPKFWKLQTSETVQRYRMWLLQWYSDSNFTSMLTDTMQWVSEYVKERIKHTDRIARCIKKHALLRGIKCKSFIECPKMCQHSACTFHCLLAQGWSMLIVKQNCFQRKCNFMSWGGFHKSWAQGVKQKSGRKCNKLGLRRKYMMLN
jgi:hypothetical protein